MKNIVTPFRVGLLVLTAAVFFILAVSFVRKGGLSGNQTIGVYADFKDASGLSAKSRVQIAGIMVGSIEDITLHGSRAHIHIRVNKSVGLRKDAAITKRAESLLGDYVLDVSPGSDGAPLMEDNGTIVRVVDSQGMEAIFGTLDKITQDIQQVTASLRDALGGPKGANSLQHIVDNMTRLSDTVDQTVSRSGENINVILDNLQGVSRDIRGLTRGEEANIKVIVENIREITHDTRSVLGTVRTIVGNNEGDLKESVASLKQTMNRLDHTLANFEEVSEHVKNGEGPVGKLLADERMGQKISETVEDVSDFASRLTRVQTEVGVKSEYLLSQGSTKNTLGIRIIPRPDKYYLLEFVDDPRGSISTQYVQNNPPAYGQPATQVQTVTSNSFKVSAEFAKRYYFTTFRFGIIESTGGVGADMNFFHDFVSLKLDAFNFSVQNLRYPRLRATLRVQALNHIFASAGADDMLNSQVHDSITNRLTAGRDFFLGGGIYFTDDDLKAILPVTGSIKP